MNMNAHGLCRKWDTVGKPLEQHAHEQRIMIPAKWHLEHERFLRREELKNQVFLLPTPFLQHKKNDGLWNVASNLDVVNKLQG